MEILKKPKTDSLIYFSALIAIFAFSLYIRAVLPYNSVFVGDIIRFGGNDPWYHMRLVKTLLHNWPHNLFFDAYTYYPHGSFIHFGPFYDYAIAIVSLIFGLGSPSEKLMDTIGAYFPAFFGAFVVFPAYYIGKHLNNRPTGLLAAAIMAIIPGQFLSRSILGFTDHHVAETLFSTATIACFIIASKKARELDIRYSDIINKNWNKIKEPIIYSVLAGVMYAFYQLSWPGAPIFGMIIVVAATIQFIADHVRNNNTEYLAIVGIIMFLTEMLLILPYTHPEMGFSTFYYSLFHPVVALLGAAAFAIMGGISFNIKQKNLDPYYYPIILIGSTIFLFIILKIVSPSLAGTLTGSFGIFSPPPQGTGPSTIAEASSIFRGGVLHDLFSKNSMVFGNFGLVFHASILSMFLIAYYVIKKWRIEETLVLVWSLMMFNAIYGQNRFAYYYAANAAVLGGYFGIKIVEFTGFKFNFNKTKKRYSNTVAKKNKKSSVKKRKKSEASLKEPETIKELKRNWHGIIFLIIIIMVLIYPWGPATMAMQQARYGGGPNMEWYNALTWLRYNTPEPNLDYYEIYDPPKPGESYQYPNGTYGVMSWWDYGHWTETIGRRIPNANPFQAGIGGGPDHAPGASTFFTENNETRANEILDKLGSKYVISDIEMATGKFYAITTWALDTSGYWTQIRTPQGFQNVPSMKYYNSMEGQLHMLDARKLNHYRLVHESTPGYYGQAEIGYKQVYNILSGDYLEPKHTGYVKIFEYVKGARIIGYAPNGTKVELNTTIKTNQGRTFPFYRTTTANETGTYEFIVPYSTEGPLPEKEYTQFDTMPTEPYTIKIGATTKKVNVTEIDVLEGRVVRVDLAFIG